MVDLNWLSTGKCASRKNVVPIRRLCCGLAADDDENALDHCAALARTVHLDFCALGDGHALALCAYSSNYRFKLPRIFALLRMIADERKSGAPSRRLTSNSRIHHQCTSPLKPFTGQFGSLFFVEKGPLKLQLRY